MLDSEYFRTLRILGYLLVGYSFLKALGLTTAIVLERLHTEYNFAKRNNYIYGEYFGIDVDEIANCLGLSRNEVVYSINELIELKFIHVQKINKIIVLYIDKEQIMEFTKESEKENEYSDWDNGLKSIQYNAYKELEMESE